MSHTNQFVTFLRHYGPIPASDNMYDELIQTEIKRHSVEPPITIPPARLDQLEENFKSADPKTVILTGTAGDGKTYHCRCIWEHFGGDRDEWESGKKSYSIKLPQSGKQLQIIKDLSELTAAQKSEILPGIAQAVAGKNENTVYLIAANDGQLLATWRDWAESDGDEAHRDFKLIEGMLVEERSEDPRLSLFLYNLSRLDASAHFQKIVDQVVEHPQWKQCEGCELLNEDGTTTCPIRINRERLRGNEGGAPFRDRLSQLLRLARSNRMHLPIRDLLLLCVNILLGDQQPNQTLLNCRKAKNRASRQEYALTNPYANVFGSNLPERQRQQYQAFITLEAFGIGRETDNKFDNLLIYGSYDDHETYSKFIANDEFYGALAYRNYLRDYLEGERENIDEFMRALARQRQRLFFSLPDQGKFSPWALSVYQSAGALLEFSEKLANGGDTSGIVSLLVRGLNRTFCGMMIDDGTRLYFASSGGDGRGRIASILDYELGTTRNRRDPYIHFELSNDGLTPLLQIVDPASGERAIVDSLELQVTHFEYLMRVAKGSLPASFSRQCYEDFLDFKLRAIERLDELLAHEPPPNEVDLKALTVDARGRPQPDDIRIRVGDL